MKLPKPILLIAFSWLALASDGAQAAVVCTIDPTNCVHANMDLTKSSGVTAYGTNEGKTGVMGEPVAGNGVVLASSIGGAPNNTSWLTLELAETVNTNLWIFSEVTDLEMRFELFVSGSDIGEDPVWVQVDSGLSVGERTFFENTNALIDIGDYGDVNYVKLASFTQDNICSGPFSPNPPDCTIYAHAMQVNGVAGTLASASAVPVPAAVWLFGSGLLGLIAVARRRK